MKEYFAKLKSLFRWRDLIFAVMLFTLMLSMAFCKGENMMDVTFGEQAVDIVTAKYTMNIPYEMVESIEVATYSEDDEQINGRSDIALRTGIWKNESWGEYYACLDLRTDTCILVHLNDGRLFVFSHKSNEEVESDFETFQSYLNP